MKPNLHRRRWGEILEFGSPSSGVRTASADSANRFNGFPPVAPTSGAAVLTVMATLFIAATAALAQLPSYTVTNLPGYNLIANQLTSPNGNSIRNVIPSAPGGSKLLRCDIPGGTFQTATFIAGAGWNPNTLVLNSGDGLEFWNSSASYLVMTFAGNPHVPELPVTNVGWNVIAARRFSPPTWAGKGVAEKNNRHVFRHTRRRARSVPLTGNEKRQRT